MAGVLTAIALVFGVTVLVSGAIRIAQVPVALAFEATHRPLPDGAPVQAGSIFPDPPTVSVIVPAYNEAVVLENCVRSIVRSDYPDFEVISQVLVPLIQRGRAASCAKLHHISSGTTLIEARRPPDVVQFREGHSSREGEQLSPSGPPFVGQRGVEECVVPDRLARVVRGEAGAAHQMTLTAKAQPNE